MRIQPGDKSPARKDEAWAKRAHSSCVATYNLLRYPRRFHTLRGYGLGRRYTLVHQHGAQAAWYNGQSLLELGMSMNVLHTCPAGKAWEKGSGKI